MFRSDRADATWLDTTLIVVCAGIFTAAVMGWARPLDFTVIQNGLDPSWMAASAWASQHGLVFGTDFIFTSGPLSILYHRQFSAGLAPFSIAIWLAYAALFGLILARLAFKQETSWTGLTASLAVTALLLILRPDYERDSLMFLACALLVLNADLSTRPSLIDVLLTIVLSSFALAKFSIFPLAVLAVVIADALYILKRRWPLCSMIFVIAVLGLFSLTGGPLSAFPAFLAASVDVASGYASAMSISGSTGELVLWLSAALILFSTSLWSSRQFWSVPLALVALALAAILWFGFKAGFVRHDLHSITAWAVLSGVAWLLALRFGHISQGIRIIGSGIAVAAMVWMHGLIAGAHPGYAWPLWANVSQGLTQIETGMRFAQAPRSWLNARQMEYDAASARLRAAAPLSLPSGTVDVLPSTQSDVIANGLSYHPRPTVQEYTSYTSGLIGLNRAFFDSASAPQYLLFRSGSIDGRHPASAEGPLWPLFLSRYEPVELVHDYILLRRRSQALTLKMFAPKSVSAAFEAWTDFPTSREVGLVSIDVRPNLLGRMASLLFKLPILTFEITNEDGTLVPYRLVPEIQRAGTILAPLIETPEQYGLLASGLDGSWPGLWPTKIRVTGERFYRFFYERALTLTFTSIDRLALRQAAENTPLTATLIERTQRLRAALSVLRTSPPMLVPSPEGIFAHAPARIPVPIAGARHLALGFGMRPGAYTSSGHSDGVCFSVKHAATQQLLFERCLDPASNAADRGTITTELALPEGVAEVVAETSCRANCAWDWSYWTMLRPSDQP